MAIVRYEPFGVLNTRPSFDALFDRLFEDAFGWGRPGTSATRSSVAANLYETQESYWVELPLPGVKAEDVEVTVQENLLTISAKRTWDMPEGAQPVWQGFGSGEWKQSFTLPGEVNPDQVQATLENGVLRLQLAKAEHIRPRTVRVQGISGTNSTPTIEGKAVATPKGSSK
jgi:HSP20 family protein